MVRHPPMAGSLGRGLRKTKQYSEMDTSTEVVRVPVPLGLKGMWLCHRLGDRCTYRAWGNGSVLIIALLVTNARTFAQSRVIGKFDGSGVSGSTGRGRSQARRVRCGLPTSRELAGVNRTSRQSRHNTAGWHHCLGIAKRFISVPAQGRRYRCFLCRAVTAVRRWDPAQTIPSSIPHSEHPSDRRCALHLHQ
jgi:hypothetical protein